MLKLKGISMSEENYKKTIEVKGSTHREKHNKAIKVVRKKRVLGSLRLAFYCVVMC